MMNRKSLLQTELVAGVTTFVTMAYIIALNPLMLSQAGTGMSFSGVLTATVLLSFLMTLLMGLYAKLPIAVAPGMGINAFFTYTLVLGQGIPWQTALGIVFWGGVIFLVLSVTPVRAWVVDVFPPSLKIGAAAGIGLLLTFIGLKNAGIIVADPMTLVKLGPLNKEAVLCIFGLVIASFLLVRKNPMAFLVSIGSITFLGWLMGLVEAPQKYLSYPDFDSVLLRADLTSALKPKFIPAMLAFVFTGFFDSVSSLVGVTQAAGLLDPQGRPKNLREGLIVDSLATVFAGLLGTSPGTAYVESTAGIEVGGKTGLTSVVTAICFLPFLFLAPLAGMVPSFATAPVLILVGVFMFKSMASLRSYDLPTVFPAFITMAVIPLTFSITNGIISGLVAHFCLRFVIKIDHYLNKIEKKLSIFRKQYRVMLFVLLFIGFYG